MALVLVAFAVFPSESAHAVHDIASRPRVPARNVIPFFQEVFPD